MATAPVSHWLTTTIGHLASLVAFFVCRQPALICSARILLSRAQHLSRTSRAESIASSVKLFEDTQDMSMYEELIAADNSDE